MNDVEWQVQEQDFGHLIVARVVWKESASVVESSDGGDVLMERAISVSSEDADLVVLLDDLESEWGCWVLWSTICCTMDCMSSTTLLRAANFVSTETLEDQTASCRSRWIPLKMIRTVVPRCQITRVRTCLPPSTRNEEIPLLDEASLCVSLLLSRKRTTVPSRLSLHKSGTLAFHYLSGSRIEIFALQCLCLKKASTLRIQAIRPSSLLLEEGTVRFLAA